MVLNIDGKKVNVSSPLDALKLGISTAFQEETLFHELSIAENIFMGQIPNRRGMIQKNEMYKTSEDLLKEVGLFDANPDTKVRDLSIASRQLVQLARALLNNAKILILDEPATALTPLERENMFKVVRDFKNKGTGIIFVSHHLKEALKISDRFTILKDGKKVKTTDVEGITEKQIINWMVGREVKDIYPIKNIILGNQCWKLKIYLYHLIIQI